MLARITRNENILVTGATSGLGLEIARLLLEKGYNVFGTGRQPVSFTGFGYRFRFIKTDFSDLKQTSNVINNLCSKESIRLVINNAGILSPPELMRTGDGYEWTLQINFLGHLVVNEIVINHNKGQMPDFIAVVSPVWKRGRPDRARSLMRGEDGYRPFNAYSDSKLLLVNLMSHYSRVYSSGCFVSFNPGVFSSGIYRMQKDYFRLLYSIAAPLMRSPSSVAQSLIAICSRTDLKSGLIYDRNGRKSVPPEPSKEFEKMITDLCNSINFGTGN